MGTVPLGARRRTLPPAQPAAGPRGDGCTLAAVLDAPGSLFAPVRSVSLPILCLLGRHALGFLCPLSGTFRDSFY